MSRLFILVLLFVVAGCARVDYDSPAIHGRVIDGATKEPIARALVSLKEHPAVKSTTDPDGKFELPAVKKVRFTLPVADMIALGCCSRGTVVVKADGHKPVEYPVPPRAPDAIELTVEAEPE